MTNPQHKWLLNSRRILPLVLCDPRWTLIHDPVKTSKFAMFPFYFFLWVSAHNTVRIWCINSLVTTTTPCSQSWQSKREHEGQFLLVTENGDKDRFILQASVVMGPFPVDMVMFYPFQTFENYVLSVHYWINLSKVLFRLFFFWFWNRNVLRSTLGGAPTETLERNAKRFHFEMSSVSVI